MDLFDLPKRKPRKRKGPPCPRCGHGEKGGHNGRECIAVICSGPDYEYDACGCKYRAEPREDYRGASD